MQKSHPGSPAATVPQPTPPAPPPATAPPSSTTPPPAETSPPALQSFSGTWFQEAEPQVLIQWAVTPNPAAPPSPAQPYMAQVWVYQLVFDTVIPSPLPLQIGPNVPFSVMNPYGGTSPFIQGTLAFTQAPSLAVNQLKFPGFQAASIPLLAAPAPPEVPGGPGSSPPAPTAGPGTGSSGTGNSPDEA